MKQITRPLLSLFILLIIPFFITGEALSEELSTHATAQGALLPVPSARRAQQQPDAPETAPSRLNTPIKNLKSYSPQLRSSGNEDSPENETAAARRLSQFEAYVNESLGWNGKDEPLQQFGYELFARGADITPTSLAPVVPDYLLGPGDEVRVSVWGRINGEYSAIIDRDGSLSLGEFGFMHIAGMTFSEAKGFIEKEASRYYKPSEVKVNVSLGELASMRVFVVGKAVRPGSYAVPSVATVMSVLMASGGPGKTGTMRDIRVNRNGKTVAVLDLYDLLLRGDKTGDIRLRPDDVIFIPSVGPEAAVSGYVKYPAIYELKGEKSLGEAFELSGGVSDIAFAGRVKVDRVDQKTRKIITIESALDESALGSAVLPGDIVQVYRTMPDNMVVRLSGAVEREGVYGIGQGLRVSDLLSLAGGLKYYAYSEEAELTRVTPDQTGPRTEKIKIDLRKAVSRDPVSDMALRENDYLFVRSVPEWDLYRTVTVGGEVRFPGKYTIKKGETISSLVERAGGYTGKAYLKGAVFTRQSVKELQQAQIQESVDRLEQEIISSSAMSIQSASNEEESKIQQAVYAKKGAILAKIRSAKSRGRISIKLEPMDRFKGSSSDLVLEEDDSLSIPETPAQVQVIGSVNNQTALVYRKGGTASDYLELAGGMTRDADKGEVYILKADGTAVKSGSWLRRSWTGGVMSTKLDPGDAIVVPEKLDTGSFTRETKDLTQILYQIAVTAGVLIVAF